jgi:hypothetical protein
VQAVLEVREFHDLIGEDERRALTPLFWSNINFYGRFRLDMDTRLDLSSQGPARRSKGDPLAGLRKQTVSFGC